MIITVSKWQNMYHCCIQHLSYWVERGPSLRTQMFTCLTILPQIQNRQLYTHMYASGEVWSVTHTSMLQRVVVDCVKHGFSVIRVMVIFVLGQVRVWLFFCVVFVVVECSLNLVATSEHRAQPKKKVWNLICCKHYIIAFHSWICYF